MRPIPFRSTSGSGPLLAVRPYKIVSPNPLVCAVDHRPEGHTALMILTEVPMGVFCHGNALGGFVRDRLCATVLILGLAVASVRLGLRRVWIRPIWQSLMLERFYEAGNPKWYLQQEV